MKPDLQQRMAAFVQLGKAFGLLSQDSAEWSGFGSGLTEAEFEGFKGIIENHYLSNGWFTPQNVRNAIAAWASEMTEEKINAYITPHLEALSKQDHRTVALICAGNIPMVGWHDVFSTLLAGHKALIKLSSDDQQLIPAALILLEKFWPEVVDQYSYATGKLENFDAVIATGSNNTSRYFQYYFSSYPHIIRKNRNSVAIITGNESAEELEALGKDIFAYFGLGCRNVTKVYVPKGYDLDNIFKAIYPYHPIVNHNKYANNYDYNKAVWLLNQDELLDNGFILFKKDTGIASPTGSLYYEYYSNLQTLREELKSKEDQIQCIVSQEDIPFGGAQSPGLKDFADGVDTLAFLVQLPTIKTA
jgi:hypothetical protein